MRTLAFDAYGTLFDVSSAVAETASHLGGVDVAAFAALWRSKQLEYTWTRTMMNQYADFWTLTQHALDFSLARYQLDQPNLPDLMMDAYTTLAAYEDVLPALTSLSEAGNRISVFTNATRAMVDAAIDSAGIASVVSEVVSLDDIRTYKTNPAAYQHLADALNVAPNDITLVSSNRWDVAGGRAFGLQAIWVNRTLMPDEYHDLTPGRTVRTLAELLS
jgi:2-haloacid dehalogenase